MSPILVILNLLGLLFTIILLNSLSLKFKKLFLYGAFIPLIIIGIITPFAFNEIDFSLKTVSLFLLRGGFLLAIISGTLTCYLVSMGKRK